MTSAAPGWYPDPRDPAIEFWWDGSRYTQSRPRAATPAPATAVVPATPTSTVVATPAVPSPAPAPSYAVAPTPYVRMIPAGTSPKSRTVAVLLGFFLGGLGVDRFYLGNIGLGVAKLLVGWLTFGLWPLIDWIIILAGAAHDGDGLPVVNWS